MIATAGKNWRRWLLELGLVVLVFLVVDQWRSRSLLAPSQQVQPVVLPALDGNTEILPAEGATLVYFFAPWCTVCHLSIGNLIALAHQQPQLTIQLVAQDYQSVEEVRRFIADQQLPFTVLLGTRQTAADWQVSAYPTYYLLDAQGRITARSVGYSSELGLWVRAQL